MRNFLTLMLLASLPACGGDNESGPGGVAPNEAKALDEAAEMVEQGRPPLPVDNAEEEPATDSNSESGSD